jgi:amidophosphoribosyltransferase
MTLLHQPLKECSVFNGEYITGDIDDLYLKRLENIRSEAAKKSKKKHGDKKEKNLAADLHSDG